MNYVYITGFSELNSDIYKIGISKSPLNRLKGLQSSNYLELELVAVHPCYDASITEDYIHEFLKDLRIRGEWVWLSPSIVRSLFIGFDFIVNSKYIDLIEHSGRFGFHHEDKYKESMGEWDNFLCSKVFELFPTPTPHIELRFFNEEDMSFIDHDRIEKFI